MLTCRHRFISVHFSKFTLASFVVYFTFTSFILLSPNSFLHHFTSVSRRRRSTDLLLDLQTEVKTTGFADPDCSGYRAIAAAAAAAVSRSLRTPTGRLCCCRTSLRPQWPPLRPSLRWLLPWRRPPRQLSWARERSPERWRRSTEQPLRRRLQTRRQPSPKRPYLHDQQLECETLSVFYCCLGWDVIV